MTNSETTRRLWILGASDPEMEAIEALLRECGEAWQPATDSDKRRVTTANAGKATPVSFEGLDRVIFVECRMIGLAGSEPSVVIIDHHQPGDPGYGKSPAESLHASSLGQVILALGEFGVIRYGNDPDGTPDPDGLVDGCWIGPNGHSVLGEQAARLIAAADHCLAAAYRGECPGVDPDALMQWRIASRAKFQNLSEDELLRRVEAARAVLRAAPDLELGIRDMRGVHVPELPEASAREGLCFIADGLKDRDGRTKMVCQSGSPEQIRAFMDDLAPRMGLKDVYGDPARGFAGGYLG